MGAMALCLLLSLILHLIFLLLMTLSNGRQLRPPAPAAPQQRQQRLVRVQRSTPTAPAQKQQEQQRKPFAKTSADTPQALPEQPDYDGIRNTRAASAPDSAHLLSDKHAPAQTGEKKDELVTFDQDRQDGDLNHEGKKPLQPPVPPQPLLPDMESTAQPQNTEPPATGREDAESNTPQPDATDRETRPAPVTPAAKQHHPEPEGELLLRKDEQKEETPSAETPATTTAQGTATGTGHASTPPKNRRKSRPIFYDPSLANPQPDTVGFRTRERRSRSTGRFIMGRGAALNVTATPLGRYESEIYRRIAYHWYQACAEHRGDIIPGSITISLRINKRGHLENMDLVRRHGAGVIQQSFTFRAIRRASLPPMPNAVRQEIVGELLELIFTFNFD